MSEAENTVLGRSSGSSRAIRRKRNIFLVVMLALPVLQWLIFWLYVNFSSIMLSFQTKQGVFTFNNFTTLFHEFQAER